MITLRGLNRKFRLDPDASVPPEMVRVPGDERVVPYIPGLDQAPPSSSTAT